MAGPELSSGGDLSPQIPVVLPAYTLLCKLVPVCSPPPSSAQETCAGFSSSPLKCRVVVALPSPCRTQLLPWPVLLKQKSCNGDVHPVPQFPGQGLSQPLPICEWGLLLAPWLVASWDCHWWQCPSGSDPSPVSKASRILQGSKRRQGINNLCPTSQEEFTAETAA